MSRDGPRVPDAPTEDLPVEDLPTGFLCAGQVLGDRYHVRSILGRGGMGEVWRAFDIKLRVEVALKAMREDLFRDETRSGLLRREVRAAREVISPNVCRLFDLVEADGRELVSMEYVDGGTLLEVLQERGPLELKEAQDIASQLLAGLEAIHEAGLIHRDVKPENIMITRAGRVVLMDFGLARRADSGAGTVSGTPAYMAPEQAAGLSVDARADVYSVGIVLAEMVSPDGIKTFESRQSLWEGVRSDPAVLPDSPWVPVLRRAVAKEPEQRYNSARTLTRALEEVTLRVAGAEDLLPYPGLTSFSESDAEFFFGREAEVEAMWIKLERSHLLALIGSSGAGKSSFLNAGLIPSKPAGWAHVICTPSSSALRSLAQAVAPAFADDPETLARMVDFAEPEVAIEVLSRWRRRHDQALLIVDQFEELFTQNRDDVRASFAEILGRLAVDADIHVLLSMRDDFLINCGRHQGLKPLFSELTPLDPPVGLALRRALVQPALQCGYRFEDDALVDEMLAEVQGERGSLPMLAFAAARLWERRDLEVGLLTRGAYHEIGGVAGALARHAEATIDRIGMERVPIVREIFRNLVTAEGTRAVRDWDEVLSVFRGQEVTTTPEAAEAVLSELVDARLLTSYEVHEEDRDPTRRVEIVHESLLANWPRLVRWQTQDADAVQVREQLRQAARTWEEHERSDDLLWTGSAYREFAVWRERYPGGLTETEEAYSAAMTALAGRRRRRRRAVVAAIVSTAVLVAASTTTLWRRSVVQERRAEAQKLIALGIVELEAYPTAALAHATQSLELADSEEARLLALRALLAGPTAFVVNEDPTSAAHFSPGGTWLVQSRRRSFGGLAVFSSDGLQRNLDDHSAASSTSRDTPLFGALEDLFYTIDLGGDTGAVGLWSAPEGRLLASANPVENPDRVNATGEAIGADAENPRALFAIRKGNAVAIHALHVDGGSAPVGKLELEVPAGEEGVVCMPRASGQWLGVMEGNDISVVNLEDDVLSEKRRLGRHEGDLFPFCDADPGGRFLLTISREGVIKVWDPLADRKPTSTVGPRGIYQTWFSKDSRYWFAAASPPGQENLELWVWSIDDLTLTLRRRIDTFKRGLPAIAPNAPWIAMTGPAPAYRLWMLGAPAGSQPIMLRRGPVNQFGLNPDFSPDGRWLATSDTNGLTLWPLVRRYPAVIRLDVDRGWPGLRFDPQGRFLMTFADRTVSLVPLTGRVPPASRVVFEADMPIYSVAVSSNGELYSATGFDGTGAERVWVGRVEGGQPSELPGDGTFHLAFSPDGKKLALSRGRRVIDLESVLSTRRDGAGDPEVEERQLAEEQFGWRFTFTSEGRLLTSTENGIVSWDVETGESELLVELDGIAYFSASADGRKLLVLKPGEGGALQDTPERPVFHDLDAGTATTLTTHGSRIWDIALDREGKVVVTCDRAGVIRVGPITGEQPHLLLGHDAELSGLAIDPLGRWIASAAQDDTVRLWPMPDLTKPPLHTLPRQQLIAKLSTLTNLRLARDPASSTGWTLTHDPFPGWETVPSW